MPLHVQVYGFAPPTADAEPTLQRLLLGADDTVTPFAEPQTPSCLRGAEQLTELPGGEPAPLQVQLNGPLPETGPAVPDAHKLLAGGLGVPTPLAEPQAPFCVVALFALHEAVPPIGLPPPVHDHVNVVPLSLTAVCVPAEHKSAEGALTKVPPWDEPQAPFTVVARFAVQLAVDP